LRTIIPVNKEVGLKAHFINDPELFLQPFIGHLILLTVPGDKAIISQPGRQEPVILFAGIIFQFSPVEHFDQNMDVLCL
jgi:hypothetical protein